MNFLKTFYTQTGERQYSISAEQGSTFAKNIAGDFNPIHDAGSKRFCVPGDLLFALALQEYGLHQRMAFQFLDLLGHDTPIDYRPAPAKPEAALQALNAKGKPVLGIEYAGGHTVQPDRVEMLLINYVAFSGQNFPHILVPLMEQHGVMINTRRPLVIYQSMAFEFEQLEFDTLDISLRDSTLDVNGKRGDANLYFSMSSEGQEIGSGIKTLVLSGLRDYDQPAIQQLCDEYMASKDAWLKKPS